MHLAANDVITVAIFCWVVCAASLNAQIIGRALSSPPLHYLGVISYSIYLVQGLVVRFWQAMFQIVWHDSIGTVQAVAVLFALMLAVVAASSLSYRFIEKPGRNLFSQLATRLSLAPVPQTASGA
jgi:peptidoglycan/LPS O-acetylase OafA/YrhL